MKINLIIYVGVGVKNMTDMKSFYQNVLGFTEVFGELPEDDHEPIHGLLRTSPTIHSAIQFKQKNGGISVALFNMVDPKPRPIRKDFRYGDIGVSKITIEVPDLDQFYEEFKDKLNFRCPRKKIKVPGWGDYHFIYAKDPEGNLIEFIDGGKTHVKTKFGIICWIGISVTNLERSIEFYKRYLGFDKVIVDIHENLSGNVDEISCSDKTIIRSCILGNSIGNSMLELFEVIQPRGRSIPFAVNWGDFGYLQLCLLGDDIRKIEKFFLTNGIDLLLSPQIMGSADPKNEGLSFLYIRDPDGIPVECMVLPKIS
jgi:catechol 2,3-dioxygenase-like lactoylglutathione lyase family enzyme